MRGSHHRSIVLNFPLYSAGRFINKAHVKLVLFLSHLMGVYLTAYFLTFEEKIPVQYFLTDANLRCRGRKYIHNIVCFVSVVSLTL